MCFDYGYDYSYDCCSERAIKSSKKPHKCSVCYRQISIGSSYYAFYEIDRGVCYTTKYCLGCFYDRLRIAVEELKNGCKIYEAFPDSTDHNDAMSGLGLESTPADEVPAWFDITDEPRMIERLRGESSQEVCNG